MIYLYKKCRFQQQFFSDKNNIFLQIYIDEADKIPKTALTDFTTILKTVPCRNRYSVVLHGSWMVMKPTGLRFIATRKNFR